MIAEFYSMITERPSAKLAGLLRGFERRESAVEERIIIGGVMWEDYVRIDEARGVDCGVPRLYWHDDQLEMMGTSPKHEELKIWIASLLDDFPALARYALFPARPGNLAKDQTGRGRAR